MKKWWLASLIVISSSTQANTYDVTKGALQNHPALCSYGYNPNCSSGSYPSRGYSSNERDPAPPPDPRIKCKAPSNGTQRCTEYYDYELTKVKKTWTGVVGGGLIGEVKNYYQNGKLESVLNFNEQGQLSGKYARYWENGKLRSDMNYNSQGQLDGTMTHYWENGKVKAVIDYKNGLAHGFSHEYDQSGKKIAIWQFENDNEVHVQHMNGDVKHGAEIFFRNKGGKNEAYRAIEWNNGQKVREVTP
ncbi:toxin-antitoxin system YwqK family antitoxin [Aggregatibacter kilianii]|uniref:toxin-antitoxin system YwqK family antitoxin n=1 Tax=Aggregatibacter kilianii TaxID=2025884 RepID=UPI000D65ECB2|nr:hypothetical protein [Aggregatibacter kilianii]